MKIGETSRLSPARWPLLGGEREVGEREEEGEEEGGGDDGRRGGGEKGGGGGRREEEGGGGRERGILQVTVTIPG